MSTNYFDKHLLVSPALITEALERMIIREIPISHFAEIFTPSEDFEQEFISLCAAVSDAHDYLYVVVDDAAHQLTLAKAVESTPDLLEMARQAQVYFFFVDNHPPVPESIEAAFVRYSSELTRMALNSFAVRK